MVGRWGMSDAIGPIAVTDGRQDGQLLPGSSPTSEPTQELIDQEVRRIVDEAERDVIGLLETARDKLEALADALLERETLDQPEAYEVAGVPLPEGDTPKTPEAAAAS
jgi:cell division protease FtsH